MDGQQFAHELKALIERCGAEPEHIASILRKAARHVAQEPPPAHSHPCDEHPPHQAIVLEEPGPPPPGLPPEFQC